MIAQGSRQSQGRMNPTGLRGSVRGLRHLNCFLCLILGSLILFTCSCNQRRAGQDEDIIFWHAMGGRLGEVLSRIISDFNDQNPDMRVRSEYMGSYSTLRQKVIASLAAGNHPDIAQSYETWTTKFMSADRIVPMSMFFNGPYGLTPAQIEDICPVFREANSYDGVLWALPFNKSVPVVYYNKDMFAAAGIQPPGKDWTWDDFLSIARTLTKDTNGDGVPDRYGFANTLSEWLLQCIIHQKGSSLFDRAERHAHFDSPEAVETLNFLVNLNRREKVAYYTTGFNNQNDFAAEKVGMIVSSCASRIYLEPVIRFPWNCAPLPRAERPAAAISGTNIVIFRKDDSQRMERAWRFVRYFTSPDVTLTWSVATGYLPVRTSAIDSQQMQEAVAKNPRILASIEQLPSAVPSPKNEAWNKGRDFLLTAIEESFIGDIPPSRSLQMANEKTQQLLDRYNSE